MKSKYKRYNIYLVDETERTLLNMIQKDLSRTDYSLFARSFTLMKIKRHNINKAMKRLQLYKSRNLKVQWAVEETISKDYKEYNKKQNELL